MDFSREECWSGRPFPSPGNLLNPGIEHESPPLQADSLPSEPPGKPYLVVRNFISTLCFKDLGAGHLTCWNEQQRMI